MPRGLPGSAMHSWRPSPGSHVRVWRGGYYHHAVFVEGDLLIENGSGVLGGVVAWVDWVSFAKGGRVESVRHPDTDTPAVVIDRAQSLVGQRIFSLLDANCEHFATWCATGRWESEQANVVKALAAVAAATAVIVVIANSARARPALA